MVVNVSSVLEVRLEMMYNSSLMEKNNLDILINNTDQFFLNVIAIIIFFMQCGFAFLEAGSVRSKNTVNILIKNMLDVFIGCISYWAIGWGLAYGEGGNFFCGGSQFFNFQLSYELYPKWFFQFVFAATAATIVSGAIAERCQFNAYFAYSIMITGWVYPPVSHWAWDGSGWLAQTGLYRDFAGSGVVHLLGGSCAIVGCFFVGPRTNRFKDGDVNNMPGHSVPLAGLGGFILIFGFLAFNGGSQGQIAHEGDGNVVALAIVNTILGGSTGGLVVLFIHKFILSKSYWSFLMCLNGALTGMVSLCAGCNLYEPVGALVVGAMGGIGYAIASFGMVKLKLDDPLDAVAVHGAGGLVGVLAVPWFMYVGLEVGERGIFWDGHTSLPWYVLGYNLAGAAAIICWSAFWSSLLFGSLHLLKMLRVSPEDECRGLDLVKHGEAAYPAEVWIESQQSQHLSAHPSVKAIGITMSEMKEDNVDKGVPKDKIKLAEHGEAAYPAEVWIDSQHSQHLSAHHSVKALGITMSEMKEDKGDPKDKTKLGEQDNSGFVETEDQDRSEREV